MSKKRLEWVTSYVTGLMFGVGLVVAGMTQPAKVVGFLDMTGDWDPSLAFVMVGAIAVHFVVYRVVFRMKSPLLGGSFGIPTRRDINVRLVGGAALFGLGWGLGGYCPGPGLVSTMSGSGTALMFVAAMLGGMVLYEVAEPWMNRLGARRKRAQELTIGPEPAPMPVRSEVTR